SWEVLIDLGQQHLQSRQQASCVLLFELPVSEWALIGILGRAKITSAAARVLSTLIVRLLASGSHRRIDDSIHQVLEGGFPEHRRSHTRHCARSWNGSWVCRNRLRTTRSGLNLLRAGPQKKHR